MSCIHITFIIITKCVSTNLWAFSIEVVKSLLSDFTLYGTIQSLEKTIRRRGDQIFSSLFAAVGFLSLWSQAICWELSLLSPDHVCKNNPRRVTNSSAGHQKQNNHDINNHLKTQPGGICRQQQPTFNLTQEPNRAVQLSKIVPIKARVRCRLALSVGHCRTSPIYFFSIFTWTLWSNLSMAIQKHMQVS